MKNIINQWNVSYKEKMYLIQIQREPKYKRIVLKINDNEMPIKIKRKELFLGIEKVIQIKNTDFSFIIYISNTFLDIAVDGMYLNRKVEYRPICKLSKKCMISILSCFSPILISQNIITVILFLYIYNVCIKFSRSPYEEEKKKNMIYIKFSIIIWIIAILSNAINIYCLQF